MNKSTKGISNKKDIDGKDPVHRAFFQQAPTEDLGQGVIYNYWKSSLLLITFLIYLLLMIDLNYIKWVCLVYSSIMIVFSVILIYGIKKEMIYRINPFDFATVQFINYLLFIFHFGFLFYSIYLLDNKLFIVPNHPNFFDFLYANISAVATIGFIDVMPNSTLIKALFITELIFSFWFLSTLIPIVIGLQTERVRQLTEAKNKFENELQNAIKEGRFTKEGNEKKDENNK